jgi:acetyl/propionyl-CoA carboxylase alpha subunit
MYAPLDGFVNTIPYENSVHEKRNTPAQYLFDQARVESSLKPLYFTNMPNQKLDALKLHHLNDFMASQEIESQKSILDISPDLLEIQFQQELIKFHTAQERYNFAKKRYELEASLADTVRERLISTEVYKREVAKEAFNRNRFTINDEGEQKSCSHPTKFKDCTGGPSAKAMIDANKARSESEIKVSEERSKMELDQFRQAVDLASNELEGAKKSLLAIAATIRLGDVYCPVRCKIKEVFVVPGQYVNKGDALFSFLWLSEPSQ